MFWSSRPLFFSSSNLLAFYTGIEFLAGC